MNDSTRPVSAIREKVTDLIIKLWAFVSLMIMSSAEVIFLLFFTKAHEHLHTSLSHLPSRAMKHAVVLMVGSLLALDVILVLAFVATEFLGALKNVKTAWRQLKPGTALPDAGVDAKARSVEVLAPGNGSTKITITVTHGSDCINISSLQLPSPNGTDDVRVADTRMQIVFPSQHDSLNHLSL